MDDEMGGCIVGIIFIAVVILIIVYIVMPIVGITAGAGVCLGGGTTIANYSRSFRENMFKTRKVTSAES